MNENLADREFDASAEPQAQRSGKSLFWAVFPSIMLPMFLAVADQTIVATALPNIASTLGGVERLSWVVVSYLIANTIAAPVYGRLGDSYGRRRMILTALAIFIIGLAALRTCSKHRNSHRDARAAGIWRWRFDDVVASVGRGNRSAA